MSKLKKIDGNDVLYGLSNGSLIGVGAALGCKGIFNLASVDPTLTLVTCVAVGLIVGVGASTFVTRWYANLRTSPKDNRTEHLGDDFPSLKP